MKLSRFLCCGIVLGLLGGGLTPSVLAAEKKPAQTREKMRELAREIRQQEARLVELVAEKQLVEAQILQTEPVVRDSAARLKLLLPAILKLASTPQDAMLLRPEPPVATMQADALLRKITPPLQTELTGLLSILQQAESRKQEIERLREQERGLMAHLQTRQRDIARQLQRPNRRQRQDLTELGNRSSSLERLMADLDALPAETTPLTVTSARWRWPVIGRIETGFGAERDGLKSDGVWIAPPSSALVVAPQGGVVKFAGPFKNFGNVLILAHHEGMYSLISGISLMSAEPGETVEVGAPLGFIGTLDSVDNPEKTQKNTGKPEKPQKPSSVYFELRQDGQAVDPQAIVNRSKSR